MRHPDCSECTDHQRSDPRSWLLPPAFIAVALLLATTSATLVAQPAPRQPEQQPDRRMVLTFDDLPFQGPSATFRGKDRFDIASLHAMNRDLVTALQKVKAPVIGFVNEGKLRDARGEQSEQRSALLEIWLSAGFELGNHSLTHRSLHRIPLEEYQRDVLLGEKTTRVLAKKHHQPKPRFFRHPFLHTGRSQEIKRDFTQFLTDHGYRIAPVTIDNSEWIFAKAYALALDHQMEKAIEVREEYLDYMVRRTQFSERQSKELLDREIPQILLLHDNRLNADAVAELVQRLRQRGYRFIGLVEALEDPAYQRPDGYEGPAGISWIERWAFAEKVDKSFFEGGPKAKQWILDLAEINSE